MPALGQKQARKVMTKYAYETARKKSKMNQNHDDCLTIPEVFIFYPGIISA